jgi:hypothetical protein
MDGVWDIKTQTSEVLTNIDPDWVNNKKVKKALPDLIAIIEGKKSAEYSHAINLLGAIGDPRAVEPLIYALSVDDITKNFMVSNALKKITKAKIGADYEYWQKWWNKNKKKYKSGK